MQVRKATAPARISFAGGGTDISPYCDQHGGCCLAVTIDKRCEAVWGRHNHEPDKMTKAITDWIGVPDMLTLNSPLQPMAGLGGSAALCVAAFKAIIPYMDKRSLAGSAFELERIHMGILGGYQDQVAAAYGGLLWMEFGIDTKVRAERMEMPSGLEGLLSLVYLGPRPVMGTDVIRDQLDRPNLEAMHRMKQLARNMKQALLEYDLVAFGELMEQAWQQKKKFSSLVTNAAIDEFHDDAIHNGAMAFKLCGAGAGGYGLVMAHPARQDQVRAFVKQRGGQAVKFSEKGAVVDAGQFVTAGN